MEILRKGKPSAADWTFEIECRGDDGYEGHFRMPCQSLLRIGSQDIVRFMHGKYVVGCRDKTWYSYGVVCSVCGCFTAIPAEQIPEEIRFTCPTIAKKGTEEYKKLSDSEKELSDKYNL